MREALRRSKIKLEAYRGICPDDKELETVIGLVTEALSASPDNMRPRDYHNSIYTKGYLDSLYDFAHWRDGVMYVGSCGLRYKDVEEQVLKQREHDKI
jgi:hypothetical protein